MPTIAELADACRVLQAKQTELDRRVTALPPEDTEGLDTLMADLEPVVTDLRDTVLQLSRVRAQDVAALRSKAAILIGVGQQEDRDTALALAMSLAYDVADVLGTSSP